MNSTMTSAPILITDIDHERLNNTARTLRHAGGPYRDFAVELESELARATIYPRQGIDPDIVTMNSTVRIQDLRTRERQKLTIVYPHEADILEGRMSVIAPLGLALIGQRAGDTVEIHLHGGTRRFLIEKVLYQPEAAGDEHL